MVALQKLIYNRKKKKQLKNTPKDAIFAMIDTLTENPPLKAGNEAIKESLSTLQKVVDSSTTETANTSSPNNGGLITLPDAVATDVETNQIYAKIDRLQLSLNKIVNANSTDSNALAESVKNNTEALQNVLSLVNQLSHQEDTAIRALLDNAEKNKNDVVMAEALWEAFQDISGKISGYAERYITREQLKQHENKNIEMIRDISVDTKQITSEMAANQEKVSQALLELANITKDLTKKSSSSSSSSNTQNINDTGLKYMQQIIDSLLEQQERMGAVTNATINGLTTTLNETLESVQAMRAENVKRSPTTSSEEILRETSMALTGAFTKFIKMSEQIQTALNTMTEQSMNQSSLALAPMSTFNTELLSQNQTNTDELRNLIRNQIEGMKTITEKNTEMEKYRQTTIDNLLERLDNKNDTLLAEFGKQLSETQKGVKELQLKFANSASASGGGGDGDGGGGDGSGESTMKAKSKPAKKQTSASPLLATSGGSGDPGGGDDGSNLLQALENIAKTFATYATELGSISTRPLQIIQQPEKATPAFPDNITLRVEGGELLGGSLNKIQTTLDGIQQNFTAEKSNQSYAPQPQLVVPDKITVNVERPLTDSNTDNELITKFLDNTKAMME